MLVQAGSCQLLHQPSHRCEEFTIFFNENSNNDNKSTYVIDANSGVKRQSKYLSKLTTISDQKLYGLKASPGAV